MPFSRLTSPFSQQDQKKLKICCVAIVLAAGLAICTPYLPSRDLAVGAALALAVIALLALVTGVSFL